MLLLSIALFPYPCLLRVLLPMTRNLPSTLATHSGDASLSLPLSLVALLGGAPPWFPSTSNVTGRRYFSLFWRVSGRGGTGRGGVVGGQFSTLWLHIQNSLCRFIRSSAHSR